MLLCMIAGPNEAPPAFSAPDPSKMSLEEIEAAMATALSPRSWEAYDKERGGLIFMVRPDTVSFARSSGHCTTRVLDLTTSPGTRRVAIGIRLQQTTRAGGNLGSTCLVRVAPGFCSRQMLFLACNVMQREVLGPAMDAADEDAASSGIEVCPSQSALNFASGSTVGEVYHHLVVASL